MKGADQKFIGLGFRPNNVDPRWWLGNGAVPESTAYTVYDPLDSINLAASYVNRANPGVRNANPVVAPTLASNGWQFNGSTQYINTGIQFNGNTDTVLIMVQDPVVNTGYCFGAWDSNTRRIGLRPNASAAPRWEFAASLYTSGYNLSGGIFVINQNGIYLNGYKYATPPSWATTAVVAQTFIGCFNQVGPVTFYNGKVCLFAHYNTLLNDSQVLAVTNSIYNKYVLSPLDSYANAVLATNPIYYLPLNNKAGFTFYKDLVRNGFASSVTGNTVTSGNAGHRGNAAVFPGTITNLLRPNLDMSTVLGLDEFSFACWIRFDAYPGVGTAVRFSNNYHNGTSEYAVLELRPGPVLGIFQIEQATTLHQTSGFPVVTSAMPLGTWNHVVHYNSKSQGVRGVYINGVRYEFSRGALPGFTTPPGYVTDYYPEIFSTLNGAAQHLAWWNRVLTQSEVNSLL